MNAVWFNQTCYNSSFLETFDESSPYRAKICNMTEISVNYNDTHCIENEKRAELANETAMRVSASEEYFK